MKTIKLLNYDIEEMLQYELSIRDQKVLALKYFLYASMLGLIPFGLLNIFKFYPPLGIFELLLSLLILVLLYSIKTTTNFTLVSTIFVIITGAVLLTIFLGIQIDRGMLIWAGLFPVIAFYLLGLRQGIIAHSIFSSILFGALLLNLHNGGYTVPPVMLANVGGALIVHGVFVYFYEYTKYKAYLIMFRHSFSDELTGTGNRRMLTLLLQKEKAASRRHLRSLSIIMIDIDHFKNVNDRFGHIVGDEILIHFANLLKKNLRQNDLFFRWGGEEFIILLPDESTDNAHSLAEKLHTLIEHTSFDPLEKMTASFGVTEVFPDESEKKTMQRLDYALYQAKEKGRNRVEMA